MYVVTFYSFKGGVGRTLALVNVAHELAQQGRRVLMVDFDLEAPGLSSFDCCGDGLQTLGVVDFVHKYLEDGRTPDVRDFILECPVTSDANGALFMMPAGRSDDSYGTRLAKIDWTELYRQERGYLMMEDMKQQWADALSPDYVLVDSRTGHTEESGICTRQLADAVVVMFFPNEQNLRGLGKIVRDIRTEDAMQRRETALHFVTSNVPDLDDEDRILSRRLERFREKLKFESLLTIHHYPSLALLNQEIFVVKRPRSRLAREYRRVLESVAEQNPADRRGALNLLERIKNHDYPLPSTADGPEYLESKLDRIIQAHPDDSEIALGAAAVYIELGQIHQAKALLDILMETSSYSAELFRLRFTVDNLQGETEAATDDLLRVLEFDDAGSRDVTFAFQALAKRSPDRLHSAVESRGFRALSPHQRAFIGHHLMDRPNTLAAAEEIFRGVTAEEPGHVLARVDLSLCLIKEKRYGEVLELLGPRERLFTDGVELADIFNFAMAEWATSGEPSVDLFDRFIASLPSDHASVRDPNFHQCKALAYWVLGKRDDAKASLQEARARIGNIAVRSFSAWRYLIVSPSEFRTDLDAVETLIDGAKITPAFMADSNQTTFM